ncbi:hypothetical protein KTT_22500 [Tengunoibacter tsumagoiensis]|uniref:Uncharacterized protein n=1 Tax=Tengunoibacter tsumagoiensis TaxID=2014871 RepID=A0A402A042_9CHLR|nr:hypothetical protein KTT_22500 [Tengunoibacter tsumagoiensis]
MTLASFAHTSKIGTSITLCLSRTDQICVEVKKDSHNRRLEHIMSTDSEQEKREQLEKLALGHGTI